MDSPLLSPHIVARQQALELTQTDLAEQLSVSETDVAAWETAALTGN